MRYSVKQAQRKFERLIEDARAGQHVIISDGKNAVRLEAIKSGSRKSNKG